MIDFFHDLICKTCRKLGARPRQWPPAIGSALSFPDGCSELCSRFENPARRAKVTVIHKVLYMYSDRADSPLTVPAPQVLLFRQNIGFLPKWGSIGGFLYSWYWHRRFAAWLHSILAVRRSKVSGLSSKSCIPKHFTW